MSRTLAFMDDVYTRLARRLDRLPAGFPATEDGVELRILERIFSPEDAQMALELSPLPEPVGRIARRLGRPPEAMRRTLQAMADKGQIASLRMRSEQHYCLAPFVVGIFEFQLPHMDRELAGLCEAYLPTLVGTLGGSAPALARVVPVNLSLTSRPAVLPHEDLRTMVENAGVFRLMDCICRTEHQLLGTGCDHTREACLAFARREDAYDEFPTWGRQISRDDALDLLSAAEREGLVHCTYNVVQDPMFVCNCCSCCCGFLRGIREHGAPHLLVGSSLVAVVDPEACLECGSAADDRCPMDALGVDGGPCEVDAERCIGCGVCVAGCPGDAIQLAPRPADARPEPPPRDIVRWNLARADARNGRMYGLGLRAWLAKEMVGRMVRP